LAGDGVTIVAATALVSLAAHNRPESDAALARLLRRLPPGYLRREGAKALNRRRLLARVDTLLNALRPRKTR